MAIQLGFLRAGWRGLAVGGACFIAPAMLIRLALAWLSRGTERSPRRVAPLRDQAGDNDRHRGPGALGPGAASRGPVTGAVALVVPALSVGGVREVAFVVGAALAGALIRGVDARRRQGRDPAGGGRPGPAPPGRPLNPGRTAARPIDIDGAESPSS
jgi:hypothetical protein